MLSPCGTTGTRWDATCARCGTSLDLPIAAPSLAEASLTLRDEHFWELEEPDFTYCPRCASERRAPAEQLGPRGKRYRRR